jgi:hypothetical protein
MEHQDLHLVTIEMQKEQTEPAPAKAGRFESVLRHVASISARQILEEEA